MILVRDWAHEKNMHFVGALAKLTVKLSCVRFSAKLSRRDMATLFVICCFPSFTLIKAGSEISIVGVVGPQSHLSCHTLSSSMHLICENVILAPNGCPVEKFLVRVAVWTPCNSANSPIIVKQELKRQCKQKAIPMVFLRHVSTKHWLCCRKVIWRS